MMWHLVVVVIMGLCMGAFAHLVRKLSRNRLPKWIVPVFASIGMLGYLAYYDYAWFSFKCSQLPAGTEVVYEQRKKSFFRPWSYVSTPVNSFVVYDGQHRQIELDGKSVVEYFTYEFQKSPIETLIKHHNLLDCENLERGSRGEAKDQLAFHFVKIGKEDPMYRMFCAE